MKNEKIYKIEPFEPGVPKVELVKIISESKQLVTVESIHDNYKFSYDKNYFVRNAKEATEEDIKKYKFELNMGNKNIKAYQFEVGVMLNKEDEEYECYSCSWDKKHGYYDENTGFTKTYEEVYNYVKNYVESGVRNTYGIISEITISKEAFDSIYNGFSERINMNYDLEKIIYSLYQNEEGQIIEDFVDTSNYIENDDLEESEVL